MGWVADVPESLSTIAEIGIGLAGFAGIVFAIGYKSQPLDPLDRMRVIGMLSGSLGVTLVAVLPLVLSDIGVAEQTVWRTSSAVFAAYMLTSLLYVLHASRSISQLAKSQLHPGVWIFVVSGSFVFALALVGNALGWPGTPSAGPYLAGLYFLLLYSSVQFLRLLLVRPASRPAV